MLWLRKPLPLLALLLGAEATLFGAPSQVPLGNPSLWPTTLKSESALTPEISAFAEKLLAEHGVPALSVGVIRRGDDGKLVTEFAAWGKSTEDGDPARPETLFSIGSCSKAFLVSSLGILIDDFAAGRNITALPPSVSSLTWDTKVKSLLPDDWELDQEWATEKANLRDIFSHVSGLTRHDLAYHRDDKPIDIIRRARHLRSKFELRQQWSYNNIMYILGGHLVTTYAGVPYREFVRERILKPLNMTSTTYHADEAQANGLSQSWDADGRRIPYWFESETLSELLSGAGAIMSNTIDMTKWLATLLNEGVDPYTNRTIIPHSTFVEMTTAHYIVNGKARDPAYSVSGYALGWLRQSYGGHDLISHSGGLPGFLTDVTFLPSDGIGLVTFANADGPHNTQALLPIRIIEDYLGLDHSLELPESYAASLSQILPQSAPTRQRIAVDVGIPKRSGGIPVERYTGEYYDPGYGTIVLCAPGSTSPPACKQILSDWESVSEDRKLEPDTLYGGIPSIWRSHLRLRRTSSTNSSSSRLGSETFVTATGVVFPEGYGRDTTPFLYGVSEEEDREGRYTAECEVDDQSQVVGCGYLGIEVGKPWEGETVRERADVFFLKVKSH